MLNKAIIDLKKLRSNALNIKRLLPLGVKFNAVVKADGYGHGGVEVASALCGIVDCFSVAVMEEGVTLRLSGIDKDILVFTEPIVSCDFVFAVRFDLTVTVTKTSTIILLEKECKRQGKKAKIHLKINTGMNRCGIDGEVDLDGVLVVFDRLKWVQVDGVYSHLCCPKQKNVTERQVNKFLLAIKRVKRYNSKVTAHISASGGFLQGFYFDMVRIGILLYGYKPFDCDFGVSPIMKVYSPKIVDRSLKKGDRLLYDETGIDSDNEVSIIRYGYADGLPRRTDGANRCMDVTAVEKFDGDFYPVMIDAEYLAKKYGTISYEILTNVSRRAERIYLR